MNFSAMHNIGAYVDLVYAAAAAALTAGGAGDNTTTTGATIDREGFSNGSPPLSALFGVAFDATLASGQTLAIGYAVQDSADGATWADFQTGAAPAVVGTGPSGGGAVKGVYNVEVDLGPARRYVRFNSNPNLSASGTDTAVTRSLGVLGGFDRLAAPN